MAVCKINYPRSWPHGVRRIVDAVRCPPPSHPPHTLFTTPPSTLPQPLIDASRSRGVTVYCLDSRKCVSCQVKRRLLLLPPNGWTTVITASGDCCCCPRSELSRFIMPEVDSSDPFKSITPGHLHSTHCGWPSRLSLKYSTFLLLLSSTSPIAQLLGDVYDIHRHEWGFLKLPNSHTDLCAGLLAAEFRVEFAVAALAAGEPYYSAQVYNPFGQIKYSRSSSASRL